MRARKRNKYVQYWLIKRFLSFFLKAEMLQDLSDSSIEFQVFGPWNFKLNIL